MKRPSVAINQTTKRKFQRRLLKWYEKYQRNLPWRKTSDPYRILVSEIMLQQTQVDRVIPKYEEFLDKYPTLEALAEAPLEEVKGTWFPLGYNVRPVRLHSIAREAMAKYGGSLPRTKEELVALKGIGDYTAGAILSFAFGQDAPILDTNVARVLYRVFIGNRRLRRHPGMVESPPGRQGGGDLKSQGVRKKLWALSEALIPRGKAYDFNQALMDFGAQVCTARKPLCLLCPMHDFCKSYPITK